MKNCILFILIALTTTSCIETDLNYTLPYTETPVAIGFLDTVNGARVFVGKNANILTRDSSIVTNAQVSLWSDVISNQVKNGLGIFGTYSSFTYTLKL